MNNYRTHVHPVVLWGKWLFDKIAALIGLMLLTLLLPPIALAIKLDSNGPVLIKQLRVGRAWKNYIEVFSLIKFRTMNVHKSSALVRANKLDPRITRVGGILRRMHIDELPQFYNVLLGDMSLIGPRPMLPSLHKKLEKEIPFYTERNYGVSPGITGLAQIAIGYNQNENENIDYDKERVSYDHAYSIALTNPSSWIRTDFTILMATIGVVIFGRGQ